MDGVGLGKTVKLTSSGQDGESNLEQIRLNMMFLEGKSISNIERL